MAINVTSSLVDNHAMLMCSVAASGWTAASLHRNIEAFSESCMVASVFAGICGVCFVAGRFRLERFLTGLFWSSGLLLIESIACNAARKHVDKSKELESTSHVMQFLCRCNYFFSWQGCLDLPSRISPVAADLPRLAQLPIGCTSGFPVAADLLRFA